MTTVNGTVAAGFEAVRDAFEANFTDHGDVGAGVAVYVDGEAVVDLVGGTNKDGSPYGADALQLVFSSTKGVAAIAAHLLVQRGQLDLDARVADLWPEFAANGKATATVGDVLSHRVGLPAIDATLAPADVLAIKPIVDALAAAAPLWDPGTAHGYHALTYGWLVGEIVRRVDGRSIGAFVAEELAGPLGLDLWIGLPDDQHGRVSPLIMAQPGDMSGFDLSALTPEIQAVLADLATAFMDPTSVTNRALSLNGTFGPGGAGWNDPDVWRSEIPAANGITNARSLAKLYAATVSEVDGIRILDDETVKRATEERSVGNDKTLIVPTRFGAGFFLPSSFSPLMGPTSFGHAGAGGSLGFADAEATVGFGYVMNKMSGNLSNDPRTGGLIEALKSSLA